MRRTTGRLRDTPGGFARNISVVSRLALVVVVVALVSVVTTSLVGLERGRSLAEGQIRDRLSAGGAARVDQVERYINGLERAIGGQALTPRPALAIDGYSAIYRRLNEQPASRSDKAAVEEYYTDVVAVELAAARNTEVSVESLVPVAPAAITLQARYVVPEPDLRLAEDITNDPTGDIADDIDAWEVIDEPFDDPLQEFARSAGFDEVYLIEPEEYVIVYSTDHNIDFATSLRYGPHSGSQLAALVDDLANDPTVGSVAVRDFAAYAPTGDAAGGFVGSPVFDGGELAGFVAGRFGTEDLTAIMTDDEEWDSLGATGETYVVAADGLLRSESRPFLEDRIDFFDQVTEAGAATDDEIRSMQFFDTTVLFQPVDRRQVDSVFAEPFVGDNVIESTNYLDNDVLADRRTVDIEGLDWAVFTEADIDSVRSPIDDFIRNLLVTIAVFIVVVTFLAVRWADRLLQPVRIISDRLRAARDGDDDVSRVELPESSADEFVELAHDIDTMLATLQHRTAVARARADERRRVLRRLLPVTIAERAEAGDRDLVEQIANATVAVLVIGGLGKLVSAGSTEHARTLLDRFVTEADELAAERQLDRVQLTGDTYVAACGVSRPHLDHAARTAAFVVDIFDVLADLDPDGELDVRAAIDVGPITVGLTGGSRLVHDTWGVTVQHATDLARSAAPGDILVSGAGQQLLPATYRLTASGVEDAAVLTVVDNAEAPS